MNEADKLFEELGYRLEYKNNNTQTESDIVVKYFNEKTGNKLIFYHDKSILSCNAFINDMQELKAINMKCKELRME